MVFEIPEGEGRELASDVERDSTLLARDAHAKSGTSAVRHDAVATCGEWLKGPCQSAEVQGQVIIECTLRSFSMSSTERAISGVRDEGRSRVERPEWAWSILVLADSEEESRGVKSEVLALNILSHKGFSYTGDRRQYILE